MAITMSFESLGHLTLARNQTVFVGWQLFPGEFPPLIDHTVMFGFDSAQHVVRVSTVDHFGDNNRAFGYSLTNISSGPAQVVTAQRYIFCKVT